MGGGKSYSLINSGFPWGTPRARPGGTIKNLGLLCSNLVFFQLRKVKLIRWGAGLPQATPGSKRGPDSPTHTLQSCLQGSPGQPATPASSPYTDAAFPEDQASEHLA